MISFDFVVEYAGGADCVVAVSADSEKEARARVWSQLTDSQRDAVSSIECVEQYTVTER